MGTTGMRRFKKNPSRGCSRVWYFDLDAQDTRSQFELRQGTPTGLENPTCCDGSLAVNQRVLTFSFEHGDVDTCEKKEFPSKTTSELRHHWWRTKVLFILQRMHWLQIRMSTQLQFSIHRDKLLTRSSPAFEGEACSYEALLLLLLFTLSVLDANAPLADCRVCNTPPAGTSVTPLPTAAHPGNWWLGDDRRSLQRCMSHWVHHTSCDGGVDDTVVLHGGGRTVGVSILVPSRKLPMWRAGES